MVEKKNVEVFITHKEETLGFREASSNLQRAKKLYPLNTGSLNIRKSVLMKNLLGNHK